jgi:hypothetical protein
VTNVVVNGVLFNDTTAPAANPVPVTVKVNAAPPAVTLEGEMLVITGPGGVMVNVKALVITPLTFTVMDADPACAIRLALTAAVNCVALT